MGTLGAKAFFTTKKLNLIILVMKTCNYRRVSSAFFASSSSTFGAIVLSLLLPTPTSMK